MVYHDKESSQESEEWDMDSLGNNNDDSPDDEKASLLATANRKESADFSEVYPLWPQLCASLVSCLGALSSGITVGFTSPALPELQQPDAPSGVQFGEGEAAIFASILGIGAVVGAPLGSLVADKLGRKYSLMFSGLPLVLGWLMIILSGNLVVMCVGRFLTGLSTSMGYLLPPLYISEIAAKNRRGALGAFVSIAENLGTVLVFGLGIQLNYRWLSVSSSVAAAALTFLMVFMPESPRWALQKGDTAGALKAVTWLMRDADKAAKECKHLLNDMDFNAHTNKAMTFTDFFTDRVVFKTIMLSVTVQVFIQYSGMDAVLNYGEQIFLNAGFEESAGLAVLSLSIFGLLSSLATIYLMESWGRTKLLMLSSTIMAAMFTLFGICLFVTRDFSTEGATNNIFFFAVLICLILYRSGYLLGWGAAGLLYPAELIPNRARGIGCGIAEMVNWLLSASVSYTFIFMLDTFKDYGTFWFYAGFNLLGLIFVYFYLPETKGVSLEDLESRMLTGSTIKERQKRRFSLLPSCIVPLSDGEH